MRPKFLIMILLLICCQGCETLFEHVSIIKIQNNSKDTIQFYASYDYPDTSIALIRPALYTVYPSTYTPLESKKNWDDVLIAPRDTISIFIFRNDLILKYTWDRIRSDYNVLERFDLSFDDLKELNWKVTYN
jgi:hypothetical protein